MGETIVRIMKGFNGYKDDKAVEDVINYIYDHPEHGLIDGINISCNKSAAIMQMTKLKKLNRNTDGVRMFHFIVSNHLFSKLEPEYVMRIGRKIAAIFKNKYQILLTVHAPTESGSRHLHFVMNTVSAKGNKFHIDRKEFYEFCETVRTIVDRCLYLQ